MLNDTPTPEQQRQGDDVGEVQRQRQQHRHHHGQQRRQQQRRHHQSHVDHPAQRQAEHQPRSPPAPAGRPSGRRRRWCRRSRRWSTAEPPASGANARDLGDEGAQPAASRGRRGFGSTCTRTRPSGRRQSRAISAGMSASVTGCASSTVRRRSSCSGRKRVSAALASQQRGIGRRRPGGAARRRWWHHRVRAAASPRRDPCWRARCGRPAAGRRGDRGGRRGAAPAWHSGCWRRRRSPPAWPAGRPARSWTA